MSSDNDIFARITGLSEHHAGIVESHLAGIIRYSEQGAHEKAGAVMNESLATWDTMGAGGRIVAGEAASILASAGIIDLAERIRLQTKALPINIHALLPMAQTLLGVKFYQDHNGCDIVEMLTRIGRHDRYGQEGRAGVLDRLVASQIDWPLGVDHQYKENEKRGQTSSSRALDIYWAGHGAYRGKKLADPKSMHETMDFVKALVRHGSDPTGGSISALAASIPSYDSMRNEPGVWLLEQVAGMGWVDDQAKEQAWSVAIGEDVVQVYRKNQELGERAKAMDRMGIEIPALSRHCTRRLSLKMVAMDKACLPMIERIKALGVDVDWVGPDGKEGVFWGGRPHSPQTLARTMQAAKGLSMGFTTEHLRRQCMAGNADVVDLILKQDHGVIERMGGDHPLNLVTSCADNDKSHQNTRRLVDLFAENARERGYSIALNSKTLKSFLRGGVIDSTIQNLDCFLFDPKTCTPMFTRICGQPVGRDTGHARAVARVCQHLVDVGIKLPGSKKRQGSLVARAMQNRNHALVVALLEIGIDPKDTPLEDFIPKDPFKDDAMHHGKIVEALLALAKAGVSMAHVDGTDSAWINPMVAQAQQQWLEGCVNRLENEGGATGRTPRRRF